MDLRCPKLVILGVGNGVQFGGLKWLQNRTGSGTPFPGDPGLNAPKGPLSKAMVPRNTPFWASSGSG